MESDLYSTDDDSLDVASKCWKRITDIAIKTGYREGIQNGADSVLQEGFDIGYKDGFETAFILGKYKSLNIALLPNIKHPVDVTAALDKTKRGICWICSIDSQNRITNTYKDILFSEVLHNQRVHSTKLMNRLFEYFQPILEKSEKPIQISKAYFNIYDK